MHAIQVGEFGTPDVLALQRFPDPVPASGQALIAVAVAPTLFLDTQIRRGLATGWFPTRPPYVPGVGVAGVVRAVGPDVDPAWTGRRVVADTGVGGGYAEQAVVPAEALVAVPDEVGLPEAAALLHDGRTALALADAARIRPGERVLITAAGGGLGSLLVQVSRAAGAEVVAAAGSAGKLDLARRLGATSVVDYSDPRWTDDLWRPDVVLDGVGGAVGRAAFEILGSGGRFFGYGAPSGDFTGITPAEAQRRGITAYGIEVAQLDPATGRALTSRALTEAAAGRLHPVIGATYPLDRAAEAHAAIEGRAVPGKTLLVVA